MPVISFSIYTGSSKQTIDKLNNVFRVSEGSGGLVINATLDKPSTKTVVFGFQYNGNNSTADNFNDFQISIPEAPSGQQTGTQNQLIFEPGETTTTAIFQININEDEFHEGNEIISLWIGDEENATINLPDDELKISYFQIEIEDNDEVPVVAFTSVKVANEERLTTTNISIAENQSVLVTISLPISKSSKDMRVKFQLSAGFGAIEGVDYDFPFPEYRLSANSEFGEFVFLAKEGAIQFFLPIYSDLINEDPEELTLTLLGSDDGNYTIGGTTSIILSINDDGNNGRPLNDTGITECYDELPTNPIPCGTGSFPTADQDGATGNDPRFYKFAFVLKSTEGVSTPVVDGADWNCVYDRTTGLLWELPPINTNSGGTYTWFNDNPTTNGGSTGAQRETDGTVIAGGTTTQQRAEELNTLTFAGGLCEVAKWRLPTVTELLSIMDFETPEENQTFIDSNYFPGDRIRELSYYWTSSPSPVLPDFAWCVFLGNVVKDSVKLCNKIEELPAIMVSTEKITTF